MDGYNEHCHPRDGSNKNQIGQSPEEGRETVQPKEED